ncbi:RNA polymerase sigma factor [Pigmentibacter sp. JX0631]|uniref:RNA polymerase sigma factor n=1 Tax=Pigmentibacter sp. JX0631 TaxID=2976982 RepID=UPI00246930BB|nr:RNA polymerase sigma factor [Pigmentibacter sp. JX0631]WGL60649.1 RNA polymerase sigma factor [Pigmentibacter sp. JX0631]
MDNTNCIESIIEVELNWNEEFVLYSKKHWDGMYRFCYSLCNNKLLSEDIHQTSLLKALKAFPKFLLNYKNPIISNADISDLFLSSEIQYHFKNWLYRIVKNTYIDEQQLHKKWKFDYSEDTLHNLSTEQLEHSETASVKDDDLQSNEKEFYRLALDDNWKKRFSELNDRQRSVIYLAAEDYSYKEISSILGVPMGTVMSTLSRALNKLKNPTTERE